MTDFLYYCNNSFSDVDSSQCRSHSKDTVNHKRYLKKTFIGIAEH